MSKRYSAIVGNVALTLVAFMPKWLRVATLARASARLVPRVPVDTARGRLVFYTPSKTAVYWPREAFQAEPETIRWIDSFPEGAVFWDIGANVGCYSLYAGLREDMRVLSFEPNPYTFNCLVNNIHLNRLDARVSGFCIAVADKPGIDGFYMESHEAGSVGNSFADPSTSTVKDCGTSSFVAAMGLSIDALVDTMGVPFPTHLKIDVDGIEDRIIAGGTKVLGDPRLRSVLVEVATGTEDLDRRAAAIFAKMKECGFTVDPNHGAGSINRLFVR
ncbi:MAG: FkbM family methyltransferase [Solirubrobacterales bacterium]